MLNKLLFTILLFTAITASAQIKWTNADAAYGPLPAGFHVYKTADSLDGKPFIAYYAEAKLKDKKIGFTTDTTYKRRLTPQQFFEKNEQPLLVVNCTFFSFATNQNLNVVMKDGKLLSYNVHSIAARGKDTFMYHHPLGSAIGINKKRKADIAWLFADTGTKKPYMFQVPFTVEKDSFVNIRRRNYRTLTAQKWKMQTAVGGGPVLLQNGEIKITNKEELKFSGKTGLTDKHPRTAMGYTADGRLIIMVIQGRNADAAGATLLQEAQLLKDLGCVEALNLDGGGSSCMIVTENQPLK